MVRIEKIEFTLELSNYEILAYLYPLFTRFNKRLELLFFLFLINSLLVYWVELINPIFLSSKFQNIILLSLLSILLTGIILFFQTSKITRWVNGFQYTITKDEITNKKLWISSKILYSSLENYSENKNVYIFKFSSNRYLFIPKKYLSENDKWFLGAVLQRHRVKKLNNDKRSLFNFLVNNSIIFLFFTIFCLLSELV